MQQPVKRGALQRAVHLHHQGQRLPARFTHWPRRCYRGQGVLGAGGGAQTRTVPGTSPPPHPAPAPADPTPAPRLTGRPPSLLAVQAPGPVGQPRTAASGRPSSTGFGTAAMTTGHPRGKRSYGSPEGAPRCARAPLTSASRPRPLRGPPLPEHGSGTGDCCSAGLKTGSPRRLCASKCTALGGTHTYEVIFP